MVGLLAGHKGKRFKVFLATVSVVVTLCVVAVFCIPIKDGVLGVPFVAKKNPRLLNNDGFYIELEVPCNRFYTREIGFRIDPPIGIDSVAGAQSSVSGDVRIFVSQGDRAVEEFIDLSNSGWSINAKGIWSKVILRYPPIGSFFCSNQNIVVETQNVNIDLKKHAITVYVSRDRRP